MPLTPAVLPVLPLVPVAPIIRPLHIYRYHFNPSISILKNVTLFIVTAKTQGFFLDPSSRVNLGIFLTLDRTPMIRTAAKRFFVTGVPSLDTLAKDVLEAAERMNLTYGDVHELFYYLDYWLMPVDHNIKTGQEVMLPLTHVEKSVIKKETLASYKQFMAIPNFEDTTLSSMRMCVDEIKDIWIQVLQERTTLENGDILMTRKVRDSYLQAYFLYTSEGVFVRSHYDVKRFTKFVTPLKPARTDLGVSAPFLTGDFETYDTEPLTDSRYTLTLYVPCLFFFSSVLLYSLLYQLVT